MKPTVLIVDDFDEIRELLGFIIESQMDVHVVQANSGSSAIEFLKNNKHVRLVVSDVNMPNGSGFDILNFIKNNNLSIPVAFVSGDDLEHHPSLRDKTQFRVIPKPFTEEQVCSVVQLLLRDSHSINDHYIPVRLDLLAKIKDIKTPLYVKINDHKFVRVTHDHSEFNEKSFEKFDTKHVTHLYVESLRAQEFIEEYRKKALSDVAWEEAGQAKGAEIIKLNTELMRDLADLLGWSDELIELAQGNVQRALYIANSNPDLSKVFDHFHKIERYGYADHCALMVLVTAKMAFEMNLGDELTLRRLTFASLFHDITLSDELYAQQEKNVRAIRKGEAHLTREIKEILSHPAKAAEICRKWDFCPSLVETIIFQHHELPDGSGFPMGKKAQELHALTHLFLVAEDFVNHFVSHYGEVQLESYLPAARTKFNSMLFQPYFQTMERILEPLSKKSQQKAS